jgi:hypothetical protein
MSMTPENATTTWRDLTDQLTRDQIEDLERYDGEIDEIIASTVVPQRRSPREVMLGLARQYSTENVLAALYGDVPPPAGAHTVDAWQEVRPQPYRVILGPRRVIGEAEIHTSVTQFADGTFDERGEIESRRSTSMSMATTA